MTHGTEGSSSLGLIKDDLIPTVGALTGSQLVRPDIYDIPTGTFDLLPRKEARLRLSIFAAHRARNRKLRHL